jgi:pimeloyl-ACP methyl ester carboxylesterase
MARVRANALEFEYDVWGAPEARPALLIAGLGAQMTSWDDDLCRLLADHGFRVIRFDNRDCGLSSGLDGPAVDPMEVARGRVSPPYTLDDMAADAAAVLEALGVPAAHVVGASMGGFIAQLLAIRRPEKVRSLVLIMTAAGGLTEDVPPTPEAARALLTPPPPDREGMIEHGVWVSRVLWGSRYFDEEDARRRAARSVDRAVRPEGALRQLAAVAAAPSRAERLRDLRTPTLVVHGEADPLIPIENGRRLAALVPHARLLTLPGVGHDVPRPVWPRVVRAIVEHAASAEAGRAAADLDPTGLGPDSSG